ncbi:hypothetical protein Tco_0710834 [Tanacetum coccineum]
MEVPANTGHVWKLLDSRIPSGSSDPKSHKSAMEEFHPLLPLGRVSLLSELAGRKDQLINMNLESGSLIAAFLSWRLSGRGGACYRNLFPRNLSYFDFLALQPKIEDEINSGNGFDLSTTEFVSVVVASSLEI